MSPTYQDGYQILVDKLWLRGISKNKTALNEWNKGITPSNELRIWFRHKPELFNAFKQEYLIELNTKKADLLRRKNLLNLLQVTLLYSAKDTEHNQIVVTTGLINYMTQ